MQEEEVASPDHVSVSWRHSNAGSFETEPTSSTPKALSEVLGLLALSKKSQVAGLLVVLLGAIFCFLVHRILGFIFTTCLSAQVVALLMANWVLVIPEGDEEMRRVSGAIREGSEAYVREMFGTIFKISLPVTAAVFLLHIFQGSFVTAFVVTLSFILGAACSSIAGIIGMWSSTRANVRVAQTACVGTFRQTLVVALRSGAVVGLTVVSLAVLGISFLFAMCRLCVNTPVEKTAELLVGYGFGASFVAMFAQLGGGIYTKAADVGADLCGKVELGIPEDDPRNPAVIADLVGDNVGDCCARGADLFESLSAEIIAAMILGGALARDTFNDFESGPGMQYILFPLVVHVVDLVVSTLGVMSVRAGGKSAAGVPEDPMSVLKQGCAVAVALAAVAFVCTTRFLLHTEAAPEAWRHFAMCGIIGMGTGYLLVLITQYYTDVKFRPVQDIAAASESGHGTNVIAGLGVGLESTAAPILLVSTAILLAYYLGRSSGLQTNEEDKHLSAGLFGTAVATMGMLSNLTYVLAMDVFGPITDNAAGIVEMSPSCPEAARESMDRLDAAGNTTKAFTKGFAVGSAGLACFLLFRAFMDIIQDYNRGGAPNGAPGGGSGTVQIDIVQPEVFIGGLIGAMTVFLFASFAMQAVGQTAQEVVAEVRRQFKEIPGIATGNARPEYARCVAIVSKTSIRMMVKPGLLVLLAPLLVGFVFRLVGQVSSEADQLAGAKSMTAYLVCSSMTAMPVALLLNNGGGAWDNAKKLIESGKHGGKGSEAHKAAVTGDTVGDPCKDTAGPSLHVLMKLTATVTMVVGPLVVLPGK